MELASPRDDGSRSGRRGFRGLVTVCRVAPHPDRLHPLPSRLRQPPGSSGFLSTPRWVDVASCWWGAVLPGTVPGGRLRGCSQGPHDPRWLPADPPTLQLEKLRPRVFNGDARGSPAELMPRALAGQAEPCGGLLGSRACQGARWLSPLCRGQADSEGTLGAPYSGSCPGPPPWLGSQATEFCSTVPAETESLQEVQRVLPRVKPK